MKKLLIGLLTLGSLSTYAANLPFCYFNYANARLDSKMTVGIATLGIGSLIDLVTPEIGISASTELLTEAIAQDQALAPQYLEEIRKGQFGGRLEKIILRKEDKRLKSVVKGLKKQGHLNELTDQEATSSVSELIVSLIHTNKLCEGKLKNTNAIKSLILENI